MDRNPPINQETPKALGLYGPATQRTYWGRSETLAGNMSSLFCVITSNISKRYVSDLLTHPKAGILRGDVVNQRSDFGAKGLGILPLCPREADFQIGV